jgi:flavin-dependent dehydrogenase
MVQMRHHGRLVLSKDAGQPFARMVMRDRFDALLVERAEAAGAEFRTGSRVTAIEETGRGIRVTADGFEAEAQLVIAADGANSTVGRMAGLGKGMYECAAWEMEVRTSPALTRAFAQTCVLGMGYHPWGYAWAFPKQDLLSIGVVLPPGQGRRLRDAGCSFLEELGLDGCEVELARGHKVRSRRGHESIANKRVVLVGDAAGLADEFTQEGIFYAVDSGQLAAQSALATLSGQALLTGYERLVDDRIMPELRAARLIGYMFYGMLRRTGSAWLQTMRRLAFLWTSFFEAQRGDSSYAAELARAQWLANIAAARVDHR